MVKYGPLANQESGSMYKQRSLTNSPQIAYFDEKVEAWTLNQIDS